MCVCFMSVYLRLSIYNKNLIAIPTFLSWHIAQYVVALHNCVLSKH